jgi:hypothetical protein
MFSALVVVSLLLAAAIAPSARAKLKRDERQLAAMHGVGFPADRTPLLGAAESAGVCGLLLGLFWWPLSVAAAIGFALYFLGACGYLLRAHITKPGPLGSAALFLVGSVAALVLRIASA